MSKLFSKNKWSFVLGVMLLTVSGFIFGLKPTPANGSTVNMVLWQKSTLSLADKSLFYASATDSGGNVYSVGYIGDGQFDFGSGVTVTGAANGKLDAVIVKYNPSGSAVWAKSTTVAPDQSVYAGVAVDSASNVYAVGTIYGNGAYTFDDGVSVSGNYASNTNGVIVKYNSAGTTQWAKAATTAPNISNFLAVSVYSDSIYVAGQLFGNQQFDFGNGATLSGTCASDASGVIIKYNSSGVAQWAVGPETATSRTDYSSIKVNSNGIYIGGDTYYDTEVNFGNNVTATGAYASYANILIVGYNLSGVAQWAKTVSTGPASSFYTGISSDPSGNLYAVGSIDGDAAYDFGNGVTVAGALALGGPNGQSNVLIVKYNSSGAAQWVRSTTVAPDYSYFNNVAVDAYGNSIATGGIYGDQEYGFGNGVTVSGASPAGFNGLNPLLVAYDTSGTPQLAESNTTGVGNSVFNGLALNSSNDIYTVGYITGTSDYNFGDGNVSGGSSNENAVVVKYSITFSNSVGPTFSSLPGDSRTINIDEGQTITTNPYIIQVKPSDPDGISKVEFYIDNNLICTATSADSNGVYSCAWDTSKYHSTVTVYAYDTYNNPSAVLERSTTVSPNLYLTTLPETGMSVKNKSWLQIFWFNCSNFFNRLFD